MNTYDLGFMDKCAEYGVDPLMVKEALNPLQILKTTGTIGGEATKAIGSVSGKGAKAIAKRLGGAGKTLGSEEAYVREAMRNAKQQIGSVRRLASQGMHIDPSKITDRRLGRFLQQTEGWQTMEAKQLKAAYKEYLRNAYNNTVVRRQASRARQVKALQKMQDMANAGVAPQQAERMLMSRQGVMEARLRQRASAREAAQARNTARQRQAAQAANATAPAGTPAGTPAGAPTAPAAPAAPAAPTAPTAPAGAPGETPAPGQMGSWFNQHPFATAGVAATGAGLIGYNMGRD